LITAPTTLIIPVHLGEPWRFMNLSYRYIVYTNFEPADRPCFALARVAPFTNQRKNKTFTAIVAAEINL